MTTHFLETVFSQYQQPLLFVVPADADQAATITQIILRATPYTNPSDNPAIHWINPSLETIGIETSRDITAELAFAPLNTDARIFVIIGFESATIEAQNALLKLFETQTNQTQFWLTTQNVGMVLPTIQSRCVVYQIPQENIVFKQANNTELAKLFNKITTASVQDCISLAGTYGDRDSAQALILSLIHWLTQQTDFVPTTRQLTLLQTAYARLEQNTNVKLALESAFFGLSGAKDHF